MATIGRWTNGTSSLTPGATYAAPNGLFGTEARNDGSAYSFDNTTATVTLPSSSLATGYLFVVRVIFNDTSNGRVNPVGEFQQTSGTGNFTTLRSAGYSRNNANNNAVISTIGFIDNPSASAEIQFRWKRDVDAMSGGTSYSVFDVIPLFYEGAAIYESSDTGIPGGTTPSQITGFSAVTTHSNVSLASDVFTLTHTTGKRWIVLGGSYGELPTNSNRTQRWVGLTIDGVNTNEFKGYGYSRFTNDNILGINFGGLVRTISADVDIELYSYRGDGTGNNQGGAIVEVSSTYSNSSITPQHTMVLIELSDDSEVFRSSNSGGGQALSGTSGGTTTVNIANNVNFNDPGTYTTTAVTNVNRVTTGDNLIFLNANAASTNVSSSTRGEGRINIVENGVLEAPFFAGAFIRGLENSAGGTYGWGCNLVGWCETTGVNDLIEARWTRTGQGHPISTQSGWVSMNVIDLDSMTEGVPPVVLPRRAFVIT